MRRDCGADREVTKAPLARLPLLAYAFTKQADGFPLRTLGMPQMKSNDIDTFTARFAISNVSMLRNKAYHPGEAWGQQQTLRIDELLTHAQEKAVSLHDRKNALMIRSLRDNMQREVTENYREIELAHHVLLSLSKACEKCLDQQQTPRLDWDPHHERLFFNSIAYPLDVPDTILVVAKAWNKGGHPASWGYPDSGKIEDEDDYRRIPGQDEDYFRRLNRDPWNADTRVFRKVIRELGARWPVSNMTAKEMKAQVEEEKQRDPTIPVTQEETEERTEDRRRSAVNSGLFGDPTKRPTVAKEGNW